MAKSYEELKNDISAITNEVEDGANTANRIGGAMADIADFAKEITDIKSEDTDKKFKNLVVQETGDGEGVVMSQKAVTEKLAELEQGVHKLIISHSLEIRDKNIIYIGTINITGNDASNRRYAPVREFVFGEGQTILVANGASLLQRAALADVEEEDVVMLVYNVEKEGFTGGELLPYLNQKTIQKLSEDTTDRFSRIDGSLAYTTAMGNGINYLTGELTNSATAIRTNYINVSGLEQLLYTRAAVPSSISMNGMAFYDAEKNYISGQRFILSQPSSSYVVTTIEVPTNAVYARFTFLSSLEDMPFVKDLTNPIAQLEKTTTGLNVQLEKTTARLNVLNGKRISIIGDSISCFGTEEQTRYEGYNAPYWEVKSVDVGQTIQSYVTWFDVYKSRDDMTLINKTIGGVLIIPDMIGTLQSFVPLAEDVGKAIGVARWTPIAYTEKAWWQYLIENTGCTLCNNASWSGSRIVAVPEGNARYEAYKLSEAYSDYTIGRLSNRDDEGNVIEPDVIFIYRGTNDFSATEIEDLATPNLINYTGIDNPLNFTESYIWTILKIREKYPNAYVILCTLNVFKRVNYTHFPTNNGQYTLPDYNNKIREIANIMGCGLVEFDKDGITFENCYSEGYITDSATTPTHPNTKGHKILGDKATNDITYIFNS